jgi:hypothetical protein
MKFSHEKKNRQKWTFLTTFSVETVYQRSIIVILSLKAFARRAKQAKICPIWAKTFEKI